MDCKAKAQKKLLINFNQIKLILPDNELVILTQFHFEQMQSHFYAPVQTAMYTVQCALYIYNFEFSMKILNVGL